jgi:uncharacterized protein (TIGR03437 family)
MVVSRFDNAGRQQKEVRFGGAGEDFISAFTTDSHGRAILAGKSYSSKLQMQSDEAVFSLTGFAGLVAAIDLDRTVTDPEITSIENGASFLEGPIAPGEILTIRGRNLGPATGAVYAVDTNGRLSDELAGVKVWIAGQQAIPLYAQSAQVNVMAPFGLTVASEVEVVVENSGHSSKPVTRQVAEAAPGVFTMDSSGVGPAAALDASLKPVSESNPVAPGGVIVLYATGLGKTNPPLPDGFVTPGELPLPVPAANVLVSIGALPAQIEWIGPAPLLPPGIVQINARLARGISTVNPGIIEVRTPNAESQRGVSVTVK